MEGNEDDVRKKEIKVMDRWIDGTGAVKKEFASNRKKNLCMFVLTKAETTAIIAIYRIFCVSLIIHFTLVTTLFQQQQIRRALKGQLKRWTVCGFN